MEPIETPPSTRPKSIYSEVVRPPIWLLAFMLFLTESVAVSLWAAFDNRVGAIAFICAFLIVIIAAFNMAMRIEVTQDWLKVGRAQIERRYLGVTRVLNQKEMALLRGRDADPAAYLALRFWQPRGVQIFLDDVRDPAPYWLITSKRPTEFVRALQTN